MRFIIFLIIFFKLVQCRFSCFDETSRQAGSDVLEASHWTIAWTIPVVEDVVFWSSSRSGASVVNTTRGFLNLPRSAAKQTLAQQPLLPSQLQVYFAVNSPGSPRRRSLGLLSFDTADDTGVFYFFSRTEYQQEDRGDWINFPLNDNPNYSDQPSVARVNLPIYLFPSEKTRLLLDEQRNMQPLSARDFDLDIGPTSHVCLQLDSRAQLDALLQGWFPQLNVWPISLSPGFARRAWPALWLVFHPVPQQDHTVLYSTAASISVATRCQLSPTWRLCLGRVDFDADGSARVRRDFLADAGAPYRPFRPPAQGGDNYALNGSAIFIARNQEYALPLRACYRNQPLSLDVTPTQDDRSLDDSADALVWGIDPAPPAPEHAAAPVAQQTYVCVGTLPQEINWEPSPALLYPFSSGAICFAFSSTSQLEHVLEAQAYMVGSVCYAATYDFEYSLARYAYVPTTPPDSALRPRATLEETSSASLRRKRLEEFPQFVPKVFRPAPPDTAAQIAQFVRPPRAYLLEQLPVQNDCAWFFEVDDQLVGPVTVSCRSELPMNCTKELVLAQHEGSYRSFLPATVAETANITLVNTSSCTESAEGSKEDFCSLNQWSDFYGNEYVSSREYTLTMIETGETAVFRVSDAIQLDTSKVPDCAEKLETDTKDDALLITFSPDHRVPSFTVEKASTTTTTTTTTTTNTPTNHNSPTSTPIERDATIIDDHISAMTIWAKYLLIFATSDKTSDPSQLDATTETLMAQWATSDGVGSYLRTISVSDTCPPLFNIPTPTAPAPSTTPTTNVTAPPRPTTPLPPNVGCTVSRALRESIIEFFAVRRSTVNFLYFPDENTTSVDSGITETGLCPDEDGDPTLPMIDTVADDNILETHAYFAAIQCLKEVEPSKAMQRFSNLDQPLNVKETGVFVALGPDPLRYYCTLYQMELFQTFLEWLANAWGDFSATTSSTSTPAPSKFEQFFDAALRQDLPDMIPEDDNSAPSSSASPSAPARPAAATPARPSNRPARPTTTPARPSTPTPSRGATPKPSTVPAPVTPPPSTASSETLFEIIGDMLEEDAAESAPRQSALAIPLMYVPSGLKITDDVDEEEDPPQSCRFVFSSVMCAGVLSSDAPAHSVTTSEIQTTKLIFFEMPLHAAHNELTVFSPEALPKATYYLFSGTSANRRYPRIETLLNILRIRRTPDLPESMAELPEKPSPTLCSPGPDGKENYFYIVMSSKLLYDESGFDVLPKILEKKGPLSVLGPHCQQYGIIWISEKPSTTRCGNNQFVLDISCSEKGSLVTPDLDQVYSFIDCNQPLNCFYN